MGAVEHANGFRVEAARDRVHCDGVRRNSVLIVDDHAVFADALQTILSANRDLAPVRVAYDLAQGFASLDAHRPDVLLLDIRLGDGDGLDLATHAHDTGLPTRTIVLSAVESPTVMLRAFAGGAHGWLPKTIDIDRLVQAIRTVVLGVAVVDPAVLALLVATLGEHLQHPLPRPLADLTPRELEILDCLALGMAREDVAAALHISVNTVRTHVQNVTAKLGVHSALEAVALRNRVRAL